MALTYEPIATTTLGSGTSSVTFSSISSAYTDLRVIIFTTPTTNQYISPIMQFNGVTSTTYSYLVLGTQGTAASSNNNNSQNGILVSPQSINGSSWALSNSSITIVDIFGYTNSSNKAVLSKGTVDTNGGGEIDLTVGLWRSTAAINSITINAQGSNYGSGTTMTIYGIKAA